MCTKDISRVDAPWDKSEVEYFTCNYFTYTMERWRSATFKELWMRANTAINHRFVITKHICCLVQEYTKISQGQAKFNSLFCCNPCSNKLGIISGCFHRTLSLGVSSNRHIINKMNDTSNWTACDYIMIQVSINVTSSCYTLTKWLWSIPRL